MSAMSSYKARIVSFDHSKDGSPKTLIAGLVQGSLGHSTHGEIIDCIIEVKVVRRMTSLVPLGDVRDATALLGDVPAMLEQGKLVIVEGHEAKRVDRPTCVCEERPPAACVCPFMSDELYEDRRAAAIIDEMKRLAKAPKLGANEIETSSDQQGGQGPALGGLWPIVPGIFGALKLGTPPAPIDAHMLAEGEKLARAGYVPGRIQMTIENARDENAKVYKLTAEQDRVFYAALVNVQSDAQGSPLVYAGSNPRTLGQRIRSARCLATVSLEKISNWLGVSAHETLAIECDEKKPTNEQLVTLARIFGLDVKALIDGPRD
jgi:hypothetical protein